MVDNSLSLGTMLFEHRNDLSGLPVNSPIEFRIPSGESDLEEMAQDDVGCWANVDAHPELRAILLLGIRVEPLVHFEFHHCSLQLIYRVSEYALYTDGSRRVGQRYESANRI